VNALVHVCPHCGYDLLHNGPILIDEWSMMAPGAPLFYDGTPIRLSNAESQICYALMKSYPRHMTRWALLDRIGTESEKDNILSVYITRIKSRLEHAGIPLPIETIWGHGYKWMGSKDVHAKHVKVQPRLSPEPGRPGRPRKV
jgi:DNA-binding response OmpR family regulator